MCPFFLLALRRQLYTTPLHEMELSRELPPELLTDVFEWLYVTSLAGYSPSFHPDGKSVRALCWPVSQVCKYWRDVALASPFLWTSLPRVNLGHHHNPSPKERLEALTELVSRTRNQPLHVSITCRKDTWIGPLLTVLDFILSLSNQWGSISIDAPAELIESIFELMQGRVGRLQSLRLCFLEWHKPETEAEAAKQAALNMFKDAPMLKNVIISGSLTATAGWQLALDTHSLEYLHVGMGSIVHSIKTTPGFEFSKLTTLEMWDRGIFDYSEMADEEVTLAFPALRSLTYQCSDWFDPDERFLLLPVAPHLERLAITAARGDIASLLIGLHKRSTTPANRSHPLKLLYIRVDLSYSFDRDYVRLLKLFSNLETLDMNFPAVEVLDALSKVEGTRTLVPQLKKCAFLFCGENLDRVNTAVARLAYERCERPPLRASQEQLLVELCIHVQYRRELSFAPRQRPGFGINDWVHLGIQPTRLEPWYGHNRQVLRSAYRDASKTIPSMFLKECGEIDVTRLGYRHTVELIDLVDKRYKAEELVDFLETNTNIYLISVAHVFRTEMTEDSKRENSTYRRIVRLLKQVRQDILNRLNDLLFHWIWESTRDKIWIRYIADEDALRDDPERFANAILGISDDLWIYDDF
ncbi:hypothetical protein D9619_001146 [Psilocybe cf. subviscida]|uniref:F-box domain-containing protein n=1 Tax=Psilocybe cf. subviscida TaxID=2480587 RepID=A0A8H5BFE1_9AGAR|nr:hypothetical protein D9619_001146 [Psilocybe cf. subviscida]